MTVYSLPSSIRRQYSPAESGLISSTNEVFTSTDRWMRMNPWVSSFSATTKQTHVIDRNSRSVGDTRIDLSLNGNHVAQIDKEYLSPDFNGHSQRLWLRTAPATPGKSPLISLCVPSHRVLSPRPHTNAAPLGQSENRQRLLDLRLHVRLGPSSEYSWRCPTLPAQPFRLTKPA